MSNPSYAKMIFQILSPHFNFRSVTFLLLLVTGLCLVVPHFFLPPLNYDHFLAKTDLPYVYLQPALIRRNPIYLYQCFTSMLFHNSYLHYTGSMMVVFLKMAPLEYIFQAAPFTSLLGGFVTNCYVALLTNYQFIGFTGVVASTIGMYAGFLILNWPYLVENYEHMIRPWLVGWFTVLAMFVMGSTSWKYLLYHFISMVLGVYMGIGFFPRYSNTTREVWLSYGFRFFSFLVILAPIVLIVCRNDVS